MIHQIKGQFQICILLMLFCIIFILLFLSKMTKVNLLVSLHKEVCINFFLSPSLSLSLCLSLSLSLSVSLCPLSLLIFTMDNRQPVYNIPKLYLSLSFSLFPPKVPLLLHLMQIYKRFCPCFSKNSILFIPYSIKSKRLKQYYEY